MNIVFISSSQYPEGGAPANRHMAYAKGLVEAGHEVTFVLLAKQREDNSELGKIGVNYICVSNEDAAQFSNLRLEKTRSIMKGRSAVVRLFESRKIDAIILLDTFGWDLIPFINLAKRKKIKVLHERTEYPYLKVFRTFKDRMNFFVYSTYVMRRFDGIYVINQALKNYFSQLLDNKVPIEIINMIVDPERFTSDLSVNNKDTEYLAYCGSINSEKDGVDILVDAFSRSLTTGRIPGNIKLMLIGEFSSENFRQKLYDLIREKNCGDNIIFTGKVERAKMPGLLKGASALVLSRPFSTQSEGGFPTKLGEYLATGNPVVVTDVGEIGLFLKDGHNAFIAKPGDAESFSEKLSELFSDRDRAIEIGKNGRMLTENEFSYLLQARKLAGFIESI